MAAPAVEWRSRRLNRFLGIRKTAGQRKPRPLGVMVVNCMSVSTGSGHARSILLKAAWTPGVDVLIGSECADFRAALVLGQGWNVYQPGTLGSPESGCVIAIHENRGTITDTADILASPAQPARPGRLGIRARSVLIGKLRIDPDTSHAWEPRVRAGHAPPMRWWSLWPTYMSSMRGGDIAGADFNKLARAVEPALGRKVLAVHVLGLAVRWWIPTSRATAVDVGGDHKAVLVTLWPARTKENK